MNTKFPAISLFDVTGPVMTGPSSSHTAGAVRIGIMGRQIFGGTPEKIDLFFYGALSGTYKGHLTDSGVVAGLLGQKVDDSGIRTALETAGEKDISVTIHTDGQSKKNPNTIEMQLSTSKKRQLIVGITLGGGEILIDSIDGIKTDLHGKEDLLLIYGPEKAVEESMRNIPPLDVLNFYRGDTLGSKVLVSIKAKGNEDIDKIKEVTGIELRTVRSLYDYKLVNPDPLLTSIREALKLCTSLKISLPEAALSYEERRSGLSSSEIREKFKKRWVVMTASVDKGLTGPNEMVGKIMGGKDARKILDASERNVLISGKVMQRGIAYAIASMETNASMGQVVACPTAGSCGVIPGIFRAVSERKGIGTEKIVDALLVASLFGVLVSMRAAISGALGGCQSEIGVASAMAAAGLAQMTGGSPVVVSEAFALALKSILGLICDPVAGPVEVPCIKRNAIGVANALAACDMALSGLASIIPPDEVIDALINTQHLLPPELRGSTSGGLGSTRTGQRLKREWLEKCTGGEKNGHQSQ